MSLMVHEGKCCQWMGTVKRNLQSLSQDCCCEKLESICCHILCCLCHPDVSQCAGWFYVGCQRGEATSPNAALPDVVRRPHLSKWCRWSFQRSCILWSTSRKTTGMGRCLLINLKEAKTTIQHMKTFKGTVDLLPSDLRKKKPHKTNQQKPLNYYNFLKPCSLLSRVLMASACLSTVGWWYRLLPWHIEEITRHKHLLSVNKRHCLCSLWLLCLISLLRKCRFLWSLWCLWGCSLSCHLQAQNETGNQACTLHWGGGSSQLPAKGATFALFRNK